MDEKERLHNFEKYVATLVGASSERDGRDHVANVTSIVVTGSGADRTYEPLLEAYIQPLLTAGTVNEVVGAANDVQKALYGLGIYRDAALSFEPSLVGNGELTAKIDLPSVKRFSAQTGTNFGNGEGSGYIKGTTKNWLGLGDIITVDTSVGTRTKSCHLVNASMPLALWLPVQWRGEILGYISDKDVEWASHKQQVRGGTMRVSNASHSFGLDAVLRSVYATSDTVSRSIRAQAGHAAKISAFHNWTKDTRDHTMIPTRGHLLRIGNELAAGDNPFYKVSLDYHKGQRLNSVITGSVGLKLGLLAPLQGSSTHVMDRFFLGGPLDVRGFRMNCLGPHDGPDSIGGQALAAAGLSLYSPLPRVKNENLKLHAFVNGGRLGSADFQRPFHAALNGLTSLSTAAGFGIMYAHPAARFELNVAFPLTAHVGDGLHKGIQFGVGLNFL